MNPVRSLARQVRLGESCRDLGGATSKGMKTHRFIEDFGLQTDDLKIDNKELLNQLRSVLKLRIGEKILLCDGKMNEGMAEIKEYTDDYIKVEIKNININKN